MKEKTLLMQALELAVKAHSGVYSKDGEPYVLHPIRVAEAVESDEEKAVAFLHDVVEDTDVTFTDINNQFGAVITNAIIAITKREKTDGRGAETYREYLDRVARDPIAKAVKLADMADNSRPERIAKLSVQKQVRLVAKYARGRHYLLTGEWYDNESLDQVIKDGYRR